MDKKNAAGKTILTINGGSSSIKFTVFSIGVANRSPVMKLKGQIERIGMPDAVFSVQGTDQPGYFTRPVDAQEKSPVVRTRICAGLGFASE